MELSGAVIGFLLGGPVGLGTLLIALFVGKIIQMTNRKIKKILQLEGLPLVKLNWLLFIKVLDIIQKMDDIWHFF